MLISDQLVVHLHFSSGTLSPFTSSITPLHTLTSSYTHISSVHPAATCAPQWRTEWFGKWWPFITAWRCIPPPHTISLSHTESSVLDGNVEVSHDGKATRLWVNATNKWTDKRTGAHARTRARTDISGIENRFNQTSISISWWFSG